MTPKEPPLFHIDLHVHSSERSSCSQATASEMIETASANGLDGLVFTDHGRIVPPDTLRELNSRHAPFRVYAGIEITVKEGEDIVVVGVEDHEVEDRTWSFADLQQKARLCGWWLCLAHPFRYHDNVAVDLKRFPAHAIEIRSANTPSAREQDIETFARHVDAQTVFASDAHSSETVAMYFVALKRLPANTVELVALLQAGQYINAQSEQRIAAWRCQQADG